MHDADGVPSRRCVKNSTLLRSRVEFPRKTILFFSLSTWQGALQLPFAWWAFFVTLF